MFRIIHRRDTKQTSAEIRVSTLAGAESDIQLLPTIRWRRLRRIPKQRLLSAEVESLAVVAEKEPQPVNSGCSAKRE